MRDRTRRLVAAVGVAALAGGIAVLPGARGGGTVWLRVLLYATGGLLGVWTLLALYRTWLPTTGIDPPPVEDATDQPVPGDDFDRTLSQFDGRGHGFLSDRAAIHRRLQDFAVEILVRRGESHEAATTAVEAGEWLDDPLVAAFLANPDLKLPRSRWDRLRGLVRRRDSPSDFQKLVRRTVDALAVRSTVVDDDARESVVVRRPADRPGQVRPDQVDDRTAAHLDPVPDGSGPSDDGIGAYEDIATGSWRATVPVALAFVGFGLVLQESGVVLAGAVTLGFTGYAKATVPPASPLVVQRTIDADRPDPGDVVEVTTTVRNDGDRTVPDIRLVDGVPEGLSVAEGSPRHGTALRPGESTSFTYAVTARRGVHEFGRTYAIVRDYAGTTGRVQYLSTADDADRSVSCVPPLDVLPVPVPLYGQTGQYLGRLPAGGGEGVEFHSTREYRPGDSTTRIDWNHLAGSPDNELTTTRFREERAATVVLAIVADETAYFATGPSDPGTFERSIDAAARLFGSLLDAGDRVGVASVGPTPTWIDPDTGVDHRKRIEEVLATDPAFPPTAPDTDAHNPNWVREFHRRFPAESQVVLLTPLCDGRYEYVINRLRGYGHPVTVVSPDVTVDVTVGQRLVRVERQSRIESLRASGVRVVDWNPDDDLAIALGRAATRWLT